MYGPFVANVARDFGGWAVSYDAASTEPLTFDGTKYIWGNEKYMTVGDVVAILNSQILD